MTVINILPSLLLCAASVHPDTINDIAKVESGFNPYAIAEIVSKDKVVSHLPNNKNNALLILERLKQNNARYSVGLMQIYSGNFKGYNISAEEMLDPCENLKIFEKILLDCYLRGGSLKNALSCYYSGNFETGNKKESQFANTSYIERIGYKNNAQTYKVPSTKEEKKGGGFKEIIEMSKEAVIYPDSLLKSSFIEEEMPSKYIRY
ncbi:lytic transglycosylase domain-containing protein [Xenorhabdus entomophaga]|uniref:lytic transglycosylase domain-containing protein n=1 Tax=Xenorhabdus entomophaga TaxID=3136257 RepID=UPI0030F44048